MRNHNESTASRAAISAPKPMKPAISHIQRTFAPLVEDMLYCSAWYRLICSGIEPGIIFGATLSEPGETQLIKGER
jgi:hypothetical protein